MREEHISVGKNVDVAIQNGLLEINKTRDEVDIKILEQGGLFKKAKVLLSYEKQEQGKEEKIENVEEQKSNDEVIETHISAKENETEIEDTFKKVEENNVFVEHITLKEDAVYEDIERMKTEIEEPTTDVVNDPILKDETFENVKKVIDSTNLQIKVTKFLEELVSKMGISATVSCVKGENELSFSIYGENVGKLIGYRGETLNAIQYLLGNLKEAGEGKIRIYLDVEGYKAKREDTLIELANKMADKAEEIERNVHLDPMNAYERRIIHTALQNRTLVETESTGEGDKRHVVVKFKR